MSKISVIQMCSTYVVKENLDVAEELIKEAASSGGQLIVLPENFACMAKFEEDILSIAEKPQQGLIQKFLSRIAKQHKIWLVAGTIPIVSEKNNKVRSACLVYNDKGDQVARYDKIHLFDVYVSDKQGHYQESKYIEPGSQMVVVPTPVGKLGLSVCYDIRFPELFRAMTLKGMQILAVPAAFTKVTGEAHWEVLLKARAIENLCYVAAAAQTGTHPNGRKTYGHSMIIDAWGVEYQQIKKSVGKLTANIDLNKQNEIRRHFPVLEHRKL